MIRAKRPGNEIDREPATVVAGRKRARPAPASSKRDAPRSIADADYEAHLARREEEAAIPAGSPSLAAKTRRVLVEWILAVNRYERFKPETFFLAVAILDRFVAARGPPSGEQTQLYGMAAHWIAQKYEESASLNAEDLAYYADGAYEARELLRAEVDVLTAVEHRISLPTPVHHIAPALASRGDRTLERRAIAEAYERAHRADYPFARPSAVACDAVRAVVAALDGTK